MPGLLDLLRPKSLGQMYDPSQPEVMRSYLREQLTRQGRTDIDVNTLSPQQMMMMIQQIPVATTGVRG